MLVVRSLLAVALVAVVSACQTYVPPGRGANLRAIVDPQSPDAGAPSSPESAGIDAILARRPGASWPVTIATVRVQAGGYRSSTWAPHENGGNWAVVSVREIEKPEHVARLRALPGVRDVTVVSSLVVPAHGEDADVLRKAAASLQADALLLYTVDTQILPEDEAPLVSLITLGLAPMHVDSLTSTAQCALVDVRTGYLYGTAESTEHARHRCSALFRDWTIDAKRLELEAKAFDGLVASFESAWPAIRARHTDENDEPARGASTSGVTAGP